MMQMKEIWTKEKSRENTEKEIKLYGYKIKFLWLHLEIKYPFKD